MKKLLNLIYLCTIAGFILVSCEGPQGPPGDDGIAVCSECHDNSQLILTKEIQWQASVHATGGHFERNSEDCAPCHTSQGFLEVLQTGEMATTAAISDPAPQNCYTCHNIHDAYDETDWELTTTDPVTQWYGGATYDKGSSNICANCHQCRVPDPLPTVGGSDVTISSPYWGIHHGPQGHLLIGEGGFEISGSLSYSNSAHTNISEGCVTCHMADAYGAHAGGHTFAMSYEYHGQSVVNPAGCTSCHSDEDALETAIEDLHLEVETLLIELADSLVVNGALTDNLDGTYSLNTGTYGATVAGALLNYKFIEEDRSGGVHNPSYTKALLQNSIEAL